MYYNKNRRYFENKKVAFLIGLGFLAAAIVLFFVEKTPDNTRIISMITAPTILVGSVLMFGSIMRRSSEYEIDDDVEKELDGFEEKAQFQLDLYGKELPYISNAVIQGYLYFDTPYIRRDKQSVYRTDHYTKNLLFFTTDGLCTASRTVHLVDDGMEEDFNTIPYRDITDVRIVKNSRVYNKGKKEITVSYYDFNVYGADGILFSCQCKYDYAIECAAEDIKKLAEKSRI